MPQSNLMRLLMSYLNFQSNKMKRISIEYFKSILEKYMDANFPELPDKEEQMETRSKRALLTYRELSGKGACHQTSLEAACLELTDGFGFPLFRFIYDLVFDHFNEIPDEIRRDFCLSILPECIRVRDSLSYDGMEECDAYDYFEEKMVEVIQKYIDAGYDRILYGITGNSITGNGMPDRQ